MDIRQITSDSNNSSVTLLGKLYETSGNCMMNGFIGDSITSYSFDENGNLEFVSSKRDSKSQIDSTGAVLSDSIVIKQIQKADNASYNHLFSWDVDNSLYTYILFDDVDAMNKCYDNIKRNNSNLCVGDISSTLSQLDVSFDSISQILLNQKVENAASLLDGDTIEAESQFYDKTSFKIA